MSIAGRSYQPSAISYQFLEDLRRQNPFADCHQKEEHMQPFLNLIVWKKAHALALNVYAATRAFPESERYGLLSQSRRAAVSVPVNIAEGCCRDGDREFARFLQVAAGSASELEYEILLSHDLGLLAGPTYQRLADDVGEVKRMLTALIRRLRTQSRRAGSIARGPES